MQGFDWQPAAIYLVYSVVIAEAIAGEGLAPVRVLERLGQIDLKRAVRGAASLWRDRSAPPGGEPVLILGLRRAAIVELLVFVGLLLLADLLLFTGDRFWFVAPHPFWAVVVLIAVQYGTNEGLVAAVACSATLLLGNIPEQSIEQDTYDFIYEVAFRPVLWLGVAVLLGELRMRHLNQERGLRKSLAQSKEREETIADAYATLKRAHKKLEVRVASELRTIVSTYKASTELQNLSSGGVLLGALDLVSTVLSPTKFSMFTVNNGVLEASLQQGWEKDDPYATSFQPGSRLFEAVVGQQRALSAENADDEKALAGEGLLAGSLFSGTSGEVVGMLKIENMGFGDLNFTAVENFKVICELMSTALGHARQADKARTQTVVAGDSTLLSETFFARQTAFLSALARRVGFPVTILLIRVENPEDLTNEQIQDMPGVLRDVTSHALRSTDMAFEYRRSKWEYAVVLPDTPKESARPVAAKLRAAVNRKLGLGRRGVKLSIGAEAIVRYEDQDQIRTGIASIGEYLRQSDYMVALARRAGFDLSLMRVHLRIVGPLSSELRARAPDALTSALRAVMSPTDMAFSLQRSNLSLAVLMPGVPLEVARRQADGLLRKFTRKLGVRTTAIQFTVTTEALTADEDSDARRMRRETGTRQAAGAGAKSLTGPVAATGEKHVAPVPAPQPEKAPGTASKTVTEAGKTSLARAAGGARREAQ